ncbi:MAG: imidazole glycerol phosphate synthase subunit HisF [Gemmatimonadaceae bacterium]
MLARRLIVCLDVRDGRVAKGVRFESLRDVGDPVTLAARYEREGADEIVFLDIAATQEGRATMLDVVQRTAEQVFIPLTVGGGIDSVADVARALRAGADKVSINSAAVARPGLITEAANRFGSQCVVASIDARRTGESWEVFTRGGRQRTGRDAIAWAIECAERGAGEILLTSVDRDGTRDGYDCELTRAISRSVSVPVVASGGAGSAGHVRDVLRDAGADAALVAGILHDAITSIGAIKEMMRTNGIPVRSAA